MDETTIKLVTSLWHSNFRNLEVRDNGNVYVIGERFDVHALSLLCDLSRTYNLYMILYSDTRGTMRVMYEGKG